MLGGVLVHDHGVECTDEFHILVAIGQLAHEVVQVVVPVPSVAEVGLDLGAVERHDLIAAVLEDLPAGRGEPLHLLGFDERDRSRAVGARETAVVAHILLADEAERLFRGQGQQRLGDLVVGEAVGQDFGRRHEQIVAAVAQLVGDLDVGHQAAVEDQVIVVEAGQGLLQVEEFHLAAVVFRETLGIGFGRLDHEGVRVGFDAHHRFSLDGFEGIIVVAGRQETGSV